MPGDIEKLLRIFDSEQFVINQFHKRIVSFFEDNPVFKSGVLPAIHSVKARVKDREHLRDKLYRKMKETDIDENNFFDIITDLSGVRVLHLYPSQFALIYSEINNQIASSEWLLYEEPVAYTWDPDSKIYFEKLGIKTTLRPSYYTSVHFVVMPKPKSNTKCEIQVRTLFEEIWGEIDHSMNYPHMTESVACREQLKVLAKLAATGTRLADSIMITKMEHDSVNKP